MSDDADDPESRARLAETQRELAAVKLECCAAFGAAVRQSTEPCPRCQRHRRCHAVVRCEPCAHQWMCVSCWLACNKGPQPHGAEGQDWFEYHLMKVASAGEQPDGSWVLYCGEESYHLHADGGGVLPPFAK